MPQALLDIVTHALGNVVGIFLFGSQVTGIVDDKSDIDVIVLDEGIACLHRRKISTPIGLLDVHLHSPASLSGALEKQCQHHVSFYTHALATGQVVFDEAFHFSAFIAASKAIWPRRQVVPDWKVYRLAFMAKLGDIRRKHDGPIGLLLATDLYQTILAVECLYLRGWLGSAPLMRLWCAQERPYSIERLDAALSTAVEGDPAALTRIAESWLTRIGGPLASEEQLIWNGLAA